MHLNVVLLVFLFCWLSHVQAVPVKEINNHDNDVIDDDFQYGICSWYGSEAHGHYTASGDPFNM